MLSTRQQAEQSSYGEELKQKNNDKDKKSATQRTSCRRAESFQFGLKRTDNNIKRRLASDNTGVQVAELRR